MTTTDDGSNKSQMYMRIILLCRSCYHLNLVSVGGVCGRRQWPSSRRDYDCFWLGWGNCHMTFSYACLYACLWRHCSGGNDVRAFDFPCIRAIYGRPLCAFNRTRSARTRVRRPHGRNGGCWLQPKLFNHIPRSAKAIGA